MAKSRLNYRLEYVCVSLRDYNSPFLPISCSEGGSTIFNWEGERETLAYCHLSIVLESEWGMDTSYYPVEWRWTPIKNYSISQPGERGGGGEGGEGCTWLIQLFSSSIQSLFPAWDESSQRSEREGIETERKEWMVVPSWSFSLKEYSHSLISLWSLYSLTSCSSLEEWPE